MAKKTSDCQSAEAAQLAAERRASLRKRNAPTDDLSSGSNKRSKSSSSSAGAQSSSSRGRSRHDFSIPAIYTRSRNQHQTQDEAKDENKPFEPQGTFPFMKLPAELRIHVYHAALARDEPLYLHIPRADKRDPSPFPAPTRTPGPARVVARRRKPTAEDSPSSSQPIDTVIPALLRVSKQIYKESRPILYANNTFNLSLTSGVPTLSTLHQRSRSLIKRAVIRIPSHHDLLDGFADLVRLGLRYCWGLKTLTIILESPLPPDDNRSTTVSVYANAFHILRWLPRGCSVVLEGGVGERVMRVVQEEGRLMSELDETLSSSH